MASELIQVRVDKELKEKASKIFEDLGLDMSTAIRMYLKRVVQDEGIPFAMTISKAGKELREIVKEMNDISVANGNSNMTLEEINAEIDAVRRGEKDD